MYTSQKREHVNAFASRLLGVDSTGLMASAIRQRSLRRGGTLAGEASGGGWREWCGCSGNALRWLP